MTTKDEKPMLSDQENAFLSTLDSRLFGIISLQDNFDAFQTKQQVVDKGIEYYEHLLLAFRKEENVARYFCQLGHYHLLSENFAKALSAYNKSIKLQGDTWKFNASFVYGLAMVYFHYNAFDWTVDLFRHLLSMEPAFSHAAEVHLRLAVIFKIHGIYPLSLSNFQEVLKCWSRQHCSLSPLEVHFHIAHLFEVQGSTFLAKSTYEKILESPNTTTELQASVYRQLGWLQFTGNPWGEMRSVSQATDLLKKSAELDKSCWETYYYLGRCYTSDNKTQDAFLAYRQAIEQNEASPDTWCSIGILYQQQGQLADALQAYMCAVRLDRGHTIAWTDLGILYEQANQYLDALACYQQALTAVNGPFERTSVESRMRTLGIILQMNGTQQEASHQKQLPCLSEACRLSIPLELIGRVVKKGLIKDTKWDTPVTPTLAQAVAHLMDQYPMNSPPLGPVTPTASHLHPVQPLQTPRFDCPAPSTSLFNVSPSIYGQPLKPPDPRHLSSGVINVMNQARDRLQPPPPWSDRSLATPRSPPPPVPSPPPIHVTKPEPESSSHPSDIFKIIATTAPSALPEIDVTDVLGTTSDAALLSPSLLDSLSPARPPGPKFVFSTAAAISSSLTVPTSVISPLPFLSPSPIGGGSSAGIPFEEFEIEFTLADEREYMRQAPLCPPKPPPSQSDLNLHPDVPRIEIKAMTDVHSPAVRGYCLSPDNPIVLLQGLAPAADIDLNLFSSQSLAETNGSHQMEIRSQRQQAADENWDSSGKRRVWKCCSTLSHMTIATYAHYQENFGQTSSEEDGPGMDEDSVKNISPSKRKRRHAAAAAVAAAEAQVKDQGSRQFKLIKFGTNADLSDEKKWSRQLKELEKIPEFARVKSDSNLLNLIDYTIHGVNSVQLYMKVPGCRTPGHQENLNFCSVNLNVGPEDSEWFAVPTVYWGAINSLCEKHRVDFLTGSWWPVLEELESEGIPVYRFLQKPGDLVWVNPGAVHWVQAAGFCNNVAWNVGPVTAHQFRMAMERYEWNKIKRVKSIVPMVTLSWNIARRMRISDQYLYKQLKDFLERSAQEAEYHSRRLKQEGLEITWRGRVEGELTYYCTTCEIEVFNLLFVYCKKKVNYVVCEACARKSDKKLLEHVIVNQYIQEEMNAVISNFRLHLLH